MRAVATSLPAASALQSMAAALCPGEKPDEAWHSAAARRQYIGQDEALAIARAYLVDGLTIPEVARLTGRSPASVFKHIQRATGMPPRAAKRQYSERGQLFAMRECGYQKPGRKPAQQRQE